MNILFVDRPIHDGAPGKVVVDAAFPAPHVPRYENPQSLRIGPPWGGAELGGCGGSPEWEQEAETPGRLTSARAEPG